MRKPRYDIGTLVQRTNGYVFVKTNDGMMAEHRWVAENRMLGRKLRDGEVVVRKHPDRLLNTPQNLVVVQHSLTKFKTLPHSRIIYIPSSSKRNRIAA